MKKLTAEWLRKAEADVAVAKRIRQHHPPLHDAVCFHCQQAAEKFLKALMQELSLAIPKTHDLDDLLRRSVSHFATLRSLRRGLVFLSDFAVDPRYPGAHTSKRQAEACLRWADRTRSMCRALLGLRLRRSRPKKHP
jgi:HEPN domain-containing protein